MHNALMIAFQYCNATYGKIWILTLVFFTITNIELLGISYVSRALRCVKTALPPTVNLHNEFNNINSHQHENRGQSNIGVVH